MTEFETPSDVPEPTMTDESAPEDQAPAVGEPPATGDAAIDEVLESLDGLASLPVSEHPAVYSRAHDALRDALAGRADAATES